MHTLRGPLPTFGEKSDAPRQDNRAGTTGAGTTGAASRLSSAPRGFDNSLEREVKSEGMRLVTEAELSRERDYWSDQIMKMAMEQVQVTIRKALSERDSERAESVQGDSGGSREGAAALTSRLNSMDLRMAGEEDKVNSALKKIEEVKAAVSMLTVELAEERREREDTSKLAEMAVRTTRCIAEGSPAESMQSSLRSIDEAHPLEEAQQDSGYTRIWEQLVAQIQRVAQELRTEVRKDVLGSLRTELSAETARQVAGLQSKVGALETHVVSELKRFAAAYEIRLTNLESLQRDAAEALGLPRSASNQNARGMPLEGMESTGGTSKPSRNVIQDEWSNADAASTSTVRDDSAVHGEIGALAHIPQSLKVELQGLVDAVGNVMTAPEKLKPKGKPSQLLGKGGMRTTSPVSRQTSRAGRAASADPTVLVSQQGARDSSTDVATTHAQASRGTSEPPLQNQPSRGVSASSGVLPSSHTGPQSPFTGSRSPMSGSSPILGSSLGGSMGGGGSIRLGMAGSPALETRLGMSGSPPPAAERSISPLHSHSEAERAPRPNAYAQVKQQATMTYRDAPATLDTQGPASHRVFPTHGAMSNLAQPISSMSPTRQSTPMSGPRVMPHSSPRMNG